MHMRVDIACYGLCVCSQILCFVVVEIIAQQTLLNHSYRIAVCDSMGKNKVSIAHKMCKDFLSFSVNDLLWWSSRGANKHTKTKTKQGRN